MDSKYNGEGCPPYYWKACLHVYNFWEAPLPSAQLEVSRFSSKCHGIPIVLREKALHGCQSILFWELSENKRLYSPWRSASKVIREKKTCSRSDVERLERAITMYNIGIVLRCVKVIANVIPHYSSFKHSRHNITLICENNYSAPKGEYQILFYSFKVLNFIKLHWRIADKISLMFNLVLIIKYWSSVKSFEVEYMKALFCVKEHTWWAFYIMILELLHLDMRIDIRNGFMLLPNRVESWCVEPDWNVQ